MWGCNTERSPPTPCIPTNLAEESRAGYAAFAETVDGLCGGVILPPLHPGDEHFETHGSEHECGGDESTWA